MHIARPTMICEMEGQMFRRAFLFCLVSLLIPVAAASQNPGIKQGDPAFYFDFPGGTISAMRGETWCEHLYAANFYWSSTLCAEGLIDTFAVLTSDLLGWPITSTFEDESDAAGVCIILDDEVPQVGTWYFEVDVCITVPCEAAIDENNTFFANLVYCDGTMTAQPDSGDCEDPNWRSGGTIACYSTITQDFVVVESPPSLHILQDTLYFVVENQSQAYVPFSICNGDPCAPPSDFDYVITNSNTEYPFERFGSVDSLEGGGCEDVYAIINGTLYDPSEYDTLTIIAWDVNTGMEYDTCVQAIYIMPDFCCMPIFERPVIFLLVLILIASAAILLRRTSINRTLTIILAIALVAAIIQGCGGEKEGFLEPAQQPDPKPIPFKGSDCQIDLNGDGSVDFVSDWLWYETADFPSSSSMIAQLICPRDENRVQYSFPEGSLALKDRTPVDEALGWSGFCSWLTSVHWRIDRGWDPSWGGPWAGAPAMSLGVSIVVDGKIHYGWIKISVDSEFGTISVHDFAYQPIPGEGILAGIHPDPIDNGEYKDTGKVPEK